MNNDSPRKTDKSFTIEELRQALNDVQLRDEIRSHYEVEAQDSEGTTETSFKDQFTHRKEAIFNSW
jgi:hypothetical protein